MTGSSGQTSIDILPIYQPSLRCLHSLSSFPLTDIKPFALFELSPCLAFHQFLCLLGYSSIMSANPQESSISTSAAGAAGPTATVGSMWIPLESDPDIMTEYLQILTLTNHYLIDMPIIEGAEEMGLFTGHNVKAFIFLFEMKENLDIAEGTDGGDETVPGLFHMKQKVRHACGSVALFHVYLNTVDASKFEPESVMAKFYSSALEQSYDKRGTLFAENSEICSLHNQFANCGQSSVPMGEDLNNVPYAYIAIVYKNGAIYTLDGSGATSKPVKMAKCTEEGFKEAGLTVCQTLIARDPTNLKYNILAFCGYY